MAPELKVKVKLKVSLKIRSCPNNVQQILTRFFFQTSSGGWSAGNELVYGDATKSTSQLERAGVSSAREASDLELPPRFENQQILAAKQLVLFFFNVFVVDVW